MDSPSNLPTAKSSKKRPSKKKSSSRRAYGSGHLGGQEVIPPSQPQNLSASSSSSTSSAVVSTSPTGSQGGEKQKRSRVTAEQLARLESLFAAEQSPSVEQRKEISASLGMHPRQTQIWFQNRRAKERIREGRVPRSRQLRQRESGKESPPKSPPGLSTGFDAELHALINEEAAVTIIPCDTLTIGTWKRLRIGEAKHSLVAYICDSQQRLSWFVHSEGKGFKMTIPFNTITSADFSHHTNQGLVGSGTATFMLSSPPWFSFETIVFEPGPEGRATRHWRECHDWTENFQASRVLRHDLTGPSGPLAHFIRIIHSRLASSADEQQRLEGESARSSSSAPSPSEGSSIQGSISPLETRSGLPAAEIFEPAFPRRSHVMYFDPTSSSSAKTDLGAPLFNDSGGSTTPTPGSSSSFYASVDLLPEASQQILSSPQASSPVSIRTGMPAPDISESRWDSDPSPSSSRYDTFYDGEYRLAPPMGHTGQHYHSDPPQILSPSQHSMGYIAPLSIPTLTRYYTLEYPFDEERTTPTATAPSSSHIAPPHSFESSSGSPNEILPVLYNHPSSSYDTSLLSTPVHFYPPPPSELNPEPEQELISPAPYSASASRLQEDFLENYRGHHP